MTASQQEKLTAIKLSEWVHVLVYLEMEWTESWKINHFKFMQSIRKYIQNAFISKKWQQTQIQIKEGTNWEDYACQWDSAEGQ